jgi:fimbrial isopeptide formation D2 family protein/uncharacterized repeat protein (TIGR01451 family)
VPSAAYLTKPYAQPSTHLGVNNAELLRFAATASGANFVGDAPADGAAGQTRDAMAIATVVSSIESAAGVISGSTSVAAISDVVTYRITGTVPEGRHQAYTVVATLPATMNLGYVAPTVPSIVLGPDVSASSSTCSINAAGTVLTCNLGTVTSTTNLSSNATRSFTIDFRAVVLNVAGVVRGSVLAPSSVVASYNNGTPTCPVATPCTVTGAIANVNVVEPTLSLSVFSLAPTTADQADVVTFTVNAPHTGASNATAHDVVFTVNLGQTFSSVSAPAVFAGCSGATAGSTSIDGLGNTIVTATCARKATATGNWSFTFTATVGSSLPASLSQTFTPLLTWTSQDGSSLNLSSRTLSDSERDGSAVLAQNNYRAVSPAPVVNFRNVAFTHVTLSSDSGSLTNARIGDRVVYRITATIPEGTRSLTFNDFFPASGGLVFERVDFVSNSISAGTLQCPGPSDCSDRLTGVVGSPASITLAGTTVSFALGNVVNSNATDGIGVSGTLVFDVTTRIANVGANTAGASQTASVDLNAIVSSRIVSGPVTVTEPNLSVAVAGAGLGLSAAGPFDGGDTFNYTLRVSNASGVTVSSAHDLALRLTIPTGLRVTAASTVAGTCNIASIPVPPTDYPVANPTLTSSFVAVLDQLAPGASCDLRLSFVVTDAALVGTTLTLPAGTLSYTSLAFPTYGSPAVTPRCVAHTALPVECLNSPERAGDGGVNNYTRAVAGFSVGMRSASLSKTMLSSANRSIGSDVSYQVVVTLPEGTTNPLTVRDTLPVGLSYVAGQTIVYSGSSAKLAFTPPAAPVVAGQNVTWTFSGVRNCNDDVAPADDCAVSTGDQTLTFTFVARVSNDAANQAENPALALNQLQLNSGPSTAIAATAANVLEPVVSMTTSISAPTGDAGDLFNVTHVLTNNGAAADPSTAFDLRLVQNFGAKMTPQAIPSVSFSPNCGGTIGAAVVGNQVTIQVQSLGVGLSCSLSYVVAVNANASAGEILTSSPSSALTWTSLDDSCFDNTGGACPSSPERNGTQSPAFNDHRVAAPSVSYTVTPLSVTHVMTSPRSRTISDTVVYSLRVVFPEGQTPLVLVDSLPPGLRYVSSRISNNPTTGLVCSGLSCTSGAALSITPTGNSVAGQSLSFNFGSVTNPGDNTLSSDFFELEITAAVDNILDNQLGRVLLKNSASLNGGPSFANDASDALAVVTVIEPIINRTISLSPSTGIDAGDIVRVSLALSHNASSTADAYDLRVVHSLPPELEGQPLSLSGTGCGVISGPGVSATSVDFTVDGIALLSGTCTVAFDVAVSATATPSTTYSASGSLLTWTGRQGSISGERTGADGTGGLNDYALGVGFSVSTQSFVTFAKTLVSSSDVVNTTAAQIAMGETATYRLDVSLNEGVNNNVVIVDTPPLGLRVTGVSLVTTGFAGTVPALTPPVLGVSGSPVTVNVGNVVVTSDNNPSNNTFSLIVSTVAEWSAALVPLAANRNTATLSVASALVSTVDIPVDFVLPEPIVTLQTSNASPQAGDAPVALTAVLANPGSGPVCDTTLVFTLPAGLIAQDPASDGIDNDSDGQSDGADFGGEGTVTGQTITVPVVGCLAGGAALGAYQVLGAVSDTIAAGSVVASVELRPYRTLRSPAGQVLDPTADEVDTNIDANVDESGDERVSVVLTPAAPTLTFTKTVSDLTDSASVTVPLDFVRYTITVSNSGTRASTGLTLSDTLAATLIGVPSSLTVSTSPASAATGSLSGNVLTANLLDLPAGGSAVVTVRARVRGGLAGGTVISNTAALATTDAYDPPNASVVFTLSSADADGDGLSDSDEIAIGTNPFDADSDDDGVADGAETQPGADSDGDGVPNGLDADSDNDGLFDGTERGFTTPVADPDNAGPLLGTNVSAGFFIADADAGATTTDPLVADSDGGGVSDGGEDSNKDGAMAGETDPNNGSDDVPVADADNDGLSDAEEQAAGTNPQDADSDDDGILDGNEASWRVDSDGDGLINALDVDSDNDGLYDGTEIGLTSAQSAEPPLGPTPAIRGTDLTRGFFVADADPATKTNPLLSDSDRGGVRDGAEDSNHNGRVDAGELNPNDPNDDLAPRQDTDQDGLTDAEELAQGLDPNDRDSDDDGVADGSEPNWSVDTDGDYSINALDPDSDNDRLFDGTERQVTTPLADPDGAGPLLATELATAHFVADANAASGTNMLRSDTDGGGMLDGVEDLDHDGEQDALEREPRTTPADDTDFLSFPVVDSDGDGVSDSDETSAGTDSNDADSDDDGIADGDEPLWNEDSDGDGLVNARDPDSDNDGLFDGTELGRRTPVADPDGAGPLKGTAADSPFFVADEDPLTRTNPLSADTDGGGVSDAKEDANGNGRVDSAELDPRDRLDDVAPQDSDGDGLSDAQEVAFATNPNDADSDDDGVTDGAEVYWNIDFDGDGLINALDPDSDDDGLFDGTELGRDCALPATNTARGRCIADADNTSTTNPMDADTDNGGVSDGSEDLNHDGAIGASESDPNVAPDTLATDSDNDGLPDATELLVGTDPNDADSDDDGLIDGSEPNYQDDTDFDGLINALDPDSDNDGLFDGTEVGLGCANPATDTAKGHCIADADLGATKTFPLNRDSDNGGVSDGVEDANRNGRIDMGETDPRLQSDDTSAANTDNDGDGLSNAAELALGTNPNDADSDDDGALDGSEPNYADDTDGDGVINALDPDSDNDGLFDGTELGLACANAATNTAAGTCVADADSGATTTSAVDRDSDDGGVSDGSEDTNKNGLVDGQETDPNVAPDSTTGSNLDSDLDGLTDAEELRFGTNPNDADSDDDGALDGGEANWRSDHDGDGLINALDPDSDNDGLFDGTEMGLGCANLATALGAGHCRADADSGATKTSPIDRDTDSGGVRDGAEDTNKDGVVQMGERDPLVGGDDMGVFADSDGDGLSDAEEQLSGTDPNDADSDDDGVVDGDEPNWGNDGDGDGLINALDPDSDNDGLYDGTELGLDCSLAATDRSAGHCIADADAGATRTSAMVADTDGGGVEDGAEDINRNGAVDNGESDPRLAPDAASVDSDGDGIPDAQEVLLHTGVNDADSDDDGVLDGAEPNYQDDTDGDGLINALDPDSDNDGLFDGTELGLGCAHPATNVMAQHCAADSDLGTTKTFALVPDSDRGGVSDGSEDTNKNGVLDAGEQDATTSPDTALVDTDGDGLSDAEETLFGTNPNDSDSDDDGLIDGDEDNWLDDTDGDGVINALDADSDNDGLFDGTERGRDCSNAATDVARGRCVADADATTKTSMLLKDSDYGGVNDGIEDRNRNGRVDADETDPRVTADDDATRDSDGDGISDVVEGVIDTDGDGTPNFLDTDSDNDGLLDAIEAGDADLATAPVDTDGDAVPDYLDLDSDNDAILDTVERSSSGMPVDSDGDGVLDHRDLDSDGDGMSDTLEAGDTDVVTSPVDSDAEGVADYLDLDSDADNIADAEEGALDTDADGVRDSLDLDSDGDSKSDQDEAGDTLLTTPAIDTDGDGTANYRDLDSDNDGVADAGDICYLVFDPEQTDTDLDGIGDACEGDSDGDGTSEVSDNCVMTANPEQRDTDSDGLGDACDPDIDGDGFLNGVGISGGVGCGAVAPDPAFGLALVLLLLRRRRRGATNRATR